MSSIFIMKCPNLEETTNGGALSWLQWIAQRSKTKTTTTESTLKTEPKDPFLELLKPSQLSYPGPAISQETLSELKTEVTSSSSAPLTLETTTTTSEMTTKAGAGTWSWWNPGRSSFIRFFYGFLSVCLIKILLRFRG